jgi:uncharacterized protein (DUF2237 family)
MMQLNVLGGELAPCCMDPLTGFYRDGHCHTGEDDQGSHTVCAKVTAVFLDFSKRLGNDLVTPRPEFNFPGLRPGDSWCVCAARWLQAQEFNAACPIILSSTHERALELIPLEILMGNAADLQTD